MKKLIVGPAGCGKTHHLLAEFETALKQSSHPLESDCYFAVPSAEHTERIITRLFQRGVNGFFQQKITTLTRLIESYFSLGHLHLVSNTMRFHFMADILKAQPWPFFEHVQQQPGFLDLMTHFLMELKDSLITAPDFRKRMNELKKTEPKLAAKYESLASIYESYEVRLKQNQVYDRQDLIQFLPKTMKKSMIRPGLKIWLDGFFDFSALQYAYLEQLSQIAENITISLTLDPGGQRSSVFEIIETTRKKLKTLGFVEETISSKQCRSNRLALQHLEKNLFLEKPSVFKEKFKDEVKIFEAVGLQGEIEMIAREILTYYRSGDYRFSDFAILLRQIGHYEDVIRAVFAQFEIPCEVHERERLKRSPIIQTVIQLLKIFQEGWKRKEIMDFLKSSYVLKLGDKERDYAFVCEMEYCSWREGVEHGRDTWLSDWKTQGGQSPDFNEKKKTYLQSIAELEDELRKAPSLPRLKALFLQALEKTFAIFRFKDSVQESVRREAVSMSRLIALMDEVEFHFKAQENAALDFNAYVEQLLKLIDLDLYSLHHRDKNRVQIYDISLARQKEYRVVFVSGLLEKSFPIQIKEDPVLSDWERQLFSAAAKTHLPEKLPRQSLERYLFYLAVTRATESVILTYPHLDREGKEALPSFYADNVEALFKEELPIKKQNLSRPYPTFKEILNAKELEIAVMGEIWRRQAAQEPLLFCLTHQILSDAQNQTRWRQALAPIRTEITDAAIQSSGFLSRERLSATRLEDYAICPYRHFAGRVLQLKDPYEDINFKQKGIILHQIFENLFKAINSGRADLWHQEKYEAFVLEELDRAYQEFPLIVQKKYQADLEFEELKEMILNFLEVEIPRLRESPLKPQYLEYSFGLKEDGSAVPYEVALQDRKLLLTGKIDRIDVDPNKQYGMVMDYKRTAEFKWDDMVYGTALQLPIYLMVMEKNLGLKPIGGELYSISNVKRKGFYHADNHAGFLKLNARSQTFDEKQYRKILNRSLEYIKQFAQNMQKGEIAAVPRKEYVCTQCSYSALCRIEKWKVPFLIDEMKRQIKHE